MRGESGDPAHNNCKKHQGQMAAKRGLGLASGTSNGRWTTLNRVRRRKKNTLPFGSTKRVTHAFSPNENGDVANFWIRHLIRRRSSRSLKFDDHMFEHIVLYLS
jgi:hypothetical protein